jgi:ribosomal protein L7Ae-like RNA K-turn-binding protein
MRYQAAGGDILRPTESKGTFLPEDVTLLLEDVAGTISPTPTEERERLIQSGVHYSEMLPLEYRPSARYLEEYCRALEEFSRETADAAAVAAEKIFAEKGERIVLASLARAGTPAGVLIKRYLRRKYGVSAPHYAVSIIRGKGIDQNAVRFILQRHRAEDVQFVDGWTGKGAILRELTAAAREFFGPRDPRRILAVLADPANVTDLCGTHEDFPIANSYLNATVCGLMSRTILRPGMGENQFHGVVFYDELRDEDRTYEFINKIESVMRYDVKYDENPEKGAKASGLEEALLVAEAFSVSDVNFVKPGIGETVRVLLRRVPDAVLLAEDAPERYVAPILQLAAEKAVPVVRYPLRLYKACGIIKAVTPEV